MPSKARASAKQPSAKSASNAPGQYQIISRPSSSDTPTAKSPPDLSQFMSRNAPTSVPSATSPQAMPTTPPQVTSLQSLPPKPSFIQNSDQSPYQSPYQSPFQNLYQKAPLFLESKPERSGTGPIPLPQATSSPPVTRNSTNTPGRKPNAQTPSKSQAYAGPLFHASPAASALPIPKWFSKTVKESKETSKKVVLETAAKKISPDQSNESPTLRRSRMDAMQLPHEHPPKFHMLADRAENGKGQDGNAMPTADDGGFISPSLSTSTLVDSSASPDADRSRQPHYRSNDSIYGCLPMETVDSIDSSVFKHIGHLQRNLSESTLSSAAPSSIPIMNREEQRKVLSSALKRLLETPAPQRPVSESSLFRTTASENWHRAFPPAQNSSGPSTSMVSSAPKPPYVPCDAYVPSPCPHNPHSENRPLSYGQRAIRMENYLSLGTSFECRPCTTASQFSQDLDGSLLSSEARAKLLEDYIQRRGSSCSCRSTTGSPQSSPSVESSSPKDDDSSKRMRDYLRRGATFECRSTTGSPQSSPSVESSSPKDNDSPKRMRDYLRRGATFECRPTLSSPQSFPGAGSTPVGDVDPKKWLDNHLRNEILKIGTLSSDSAAGVVT